MAKKVGSIKAKRYVSDVFTHTFLIIMAIVWLIPFVWLVAHSFRDTPGQFIKTFFPTDWTLDNYKLLFTEKSVMDFPRMFMNTFVIAIFTCIISSFLVLAVSYCMSRLKWKMRKPYMNMGMVITLFPGFMSMTAQYFLLKALGLTEGDMVPFALIICYTSGAGVGFYVMKGYMDTIPKALDEAAYLDGATKWQTFTRITLPLCKPMIVYQLITSFMGPWVDFVLAKLITGANAKYFTVSIGLWNMLEKEYSYDWFTRFCAGAVLVSIPIAVLFMYTQKFYQEAMSGGVKG
jgi:arabinogalactan oligomer/maltooligosaccharide transport system permease protein